jgi:hypothetical protein
MSYTPEQLLEILSNYEKLTDNSLLKNAKGKEKKKLDPKAKVRNRGTVCVPAESAKDKKDHFPINDEGQARSALSRVEGLSSAPWYNGSLEGLKALVKRKVHSKFPGIGKDEKKKKSAERLAALTKISQKVQFHTPFMFLLQMPYEELVKVMRSAPHEIVKEYAREAERKLADCVLPQEAEPFEKVLRAIKARHNVQLLGPEGKDLLTASRFDQLIKKYSEENQAVERLIAKYSQITPNTYSYWNPKALADNAKAGNINLDDLHRSGKITNQQYDQAYQILNGTPAPGAAQPRKVELPHSELRPVGGETPQAPLPTNVDRGGYHIDEKGVWHKKPTHQAKRDPDGFDTKAIQQQLLNKGYNLGPTGVDGDWGQLSEAAFRNFKKDFYLQQVNDKEAKRRLLSNELPTNMRPQTAKPTPFLGPKDPGY